MLTYGPLFAVLPEVDSTNIVVYLTDLICESDMFEVDQRNLVKVRLYFLRLW